MVLLTPLPPAVATGRPTALRSCSRIIDSRHVLAAELGAPLSNPIAPFLEGARTLDEVSTLPPLSEQAAAWDRISTHLAGEIERLDTPRLAAAARPFPGSDGTVLGALAFLAQHDTYHLGQIALLRRQAGLPGMRYTVRPREPGREGA